MEGNSVIEATSPTCNVTGHIIEIGRITQAIAFKENRNPPPLVFTDEYKNAIVESWHYVERHVSEVNLVIK